MQEGNTFYHRNGNRFKATHFAIPHWMARCSTKRTVEEDTVDQYLVNPIRDVLQELENPGSTRDTHFLRTRRLGPETPSDNDESEDGQTWQDSEDSGPCHGFSSTSPDIPPGEEPEEHQDPPIEEDEEFKEILTKIQELTKDTPVGPIEETRGDAVPPITIRRTERGYTILSTPANPQPPQTHARTREEAELEDTNEEDQPEPKKTRSGSHY